MDILIAETQFVITVQEDNGTIDGDAPVLVEKRSNKRAKNQMDLTAHRLKLFLCENLSDFVPDNEIHCFTMHKRNGCIFRAHTSYRSMTAWHDWANFQWDVEDAEGNVEQMIIPGEIQCFVDLRKVFKEPRIVGIDDHTGVEITADPPFPPGIYAVINSLHEPTQPLFDSVLLNRGHREMTADGHMDLQLVDVESLHSPTFCFPHFGGEDEAEVFQLKAREMWQCEF
jgi:hypothetical protein